MKLFNKQNKPQEQTSFRKKRYSGFEKIWMNYLGNLPYSSDGKTRNYDKVLLMIRNGLIYSKWITVGLMGLIITLIVFRIQLPIVVFLFLFIVILAHIYIALWLGFTNTNLTSRQLDILFQRGRLSNNDRIQLIKDYAFLSFRIAISNSLLLIILTLNNFVMALVNQAFVNTKNLLMYSDIYFKYDALSPLFFGGQLVNIIMLLAPVPLFYILIRESYKREIVKWNDILEVRIKERFFRAPEITRLITDYENDAEANLELGRDAKSGEKVVLKANTLLYNTFFIGATGTGKSAAVANNIAIQTTEKAILYFKKRAEYIKKVESELNGKMLTRKSMESLKNQKLEEWFTSGESKLLLNGFYINEPAGNLVANVEEILKKDGVPKEMRWKLDPTSEDTEGINILDTSWEDASGLLANLIKLFAEEGGEGGSTFFKTAEETYIRFLIVILKITSQIDECYLDINLNGRAPTLTQVSEMLDDTSIIIKRLKIFKVYRSMIKRKLDKLEEEYREIFTSELNEFIKNGGDRRLFSERNSEKLSILLPKVNDFRSDYTVINQAYNYFANNYYIDAITNLPSFRQEANVEGLKNTIRNLSSSKLAQRVLFNQSSKNVDVFLKAGGFILVTTARGEMDDILSRRLGKVIDLTIQRSVLRRIPETSPFFPLITDENAWVITKNTETFVNQNRKYHAPMISLFQNYEQTEAELGESLTKALLSSYRNGFVFQDGSEGSIRIVADKAGTTMQVVKTFTFQDEDILAGHDNNSTSTREEIKEVEAIRKNDLLKQEKFGFTGVYTENDEVSDVTQVIPTPYFEHQMFDKNVTWKPRFDIVKNREDKEAFECWKEEVARYTLERFENNIIRLSEFTEDEIRVIRGEVTEDDEEVDLGKRTEKEPKKKASGKSASSANTEAKKLIPKPKEAALTIIDVIENGEFPIENNFDNQPIDEIGIDLGGMVSDVNSDTTVISNIQTSQEDKVTHVSVDKLSKLEEASTDTSDTVRQGNVPDQSSKHSIFDLMNN